MRRRCAGAWTPGPATASPATVIRPASRRSRPATHRSRVVLPQPDGPSTATREPVGTARSTPDSAVTRPYDLVAAETVSALIGALPDEVRPRGRRGSRWGRRTAAPAAPR